MIDKIDTKTKEEEVIAKLDTFDELPDAPPKRRIKTVMGGQSLCCSGRFLAGDLYHRSIHRALP